MRRERFRDRTRANGRGLTVALGIGAGLAIAGAIAFGQESRATAVVTYALIALGFCGGVGYIAGHFVRKYW